MQWLTRGNGDGVRDWLGVEERRKQKV